MDGLESVTNGMREDGKLLSVVAFHIPLGLEENQTTCEMRTVQCSIPTKSGMT